MNISNARLLYGLTALIVGTVAICFSVLTVVVYEGGLQAFSLPIVSGTLALIVVELALFSHAPLEPILARRFRLHNRKRLHLLLFVAAFGGYIFLNLSLIGMARHDTDSSNLWYGPASLLAAVLLTAVITTWPTPIDRKRHPRRSKWDQ